ncbi:MAG: S41 family peptidase [Phycisphaerales bacterium]
MRTARHGVLFCFALRFIVAAVAICCAAGPAWAEPITRAEKERLIASAEKLVKERAYASGTDFTKWSEIRTKYQKQIDNAATDIEFTRVLNRALREFGISHIDLTTPSAAQQRRQNEFVGIGIRHSGEGIDRGVTIKGITPSGPAAEAGLDVGDVITAVDSHEITGPEMLTEGAKLALTVMRGNDETRVVTLMRAESPMGLGLSYDRKPLSRGLTIQSLITAGPAEKAGLKVGDTITHVDGAKIYDPSIIRGEEGSKLTLTVRRTDGTVEDVTLTREKIITKEAETFTRLSDEASMIKIPTFSTGYDRKKVEEFFTQAKDDKYLVIDLTFNGGGAVDNMLHFLSFLLPRGTAIGTSVSKRVADRYAEQTKGDPTDVVKVAEWADAKMRIRRGNLTPFAGKVAVLTNRASASASEIVANALRELKDGIVVGNPTAGAVLVSTPVKLEDGFEMKVPISDYVTIKGKRLEKHPTDPDLVTRVRTPAEVEAAARKAVDLMKNPPAEAADPKDADAKHEPAEPVPAGMP